MKFKAEAQHLLFQAYQHSSKPSEDQLGFAYNPHGFVCLKKAQKKTTTTLPHWAVVEIQRGQQGYICCLPWHEVQYYSSEDLEP